MVIIKDNQYYIPITPNGYGTFRKKDIAAIKFFSNITGKPLPNKQVYGSGADNSTDMTGVFIVKELEEGSINILWYAVGHYNLPYYPYKPSLDKVYSCTDVYVRDQFILTFYLATPDQIIRVTIDDVDYEFDGANGLTNELYIQPDKKWTATLIHKSHWDNYGTLSKSSGVATEDENISATVPYNNSYNDYNDGCGCGNE